MLNTDSYYEIGSGHTFCQDYADSGKFSVAGDTYYYALVSDGCSGSKGSDIGARWLAKMFPLVVQDLILNGSFSCEGVCNTLKVKILFAAKDLGLDISAFDATLVAILYDQTKDALHTFAWGDGKIFYKYKNDTGFATDINYESNAPYYLSHQTLPERELRYINTFGMKFAEIQSYLVTPDSTILIPETLKKQQEFHTETHTSASYLFAHASVFTDGAGTYHKAGDTGILMPDHNVYNQLTQYKATHGEFVQRRMQMVKKFCQKEGWTHFDDVAVATIAF